LQRSKNDEPKPAPGLEKLAGETYKKIEHCAVFDPWMSERELLKQSAFSKDVALDMKDAEINRLTAENKEMRETLNFIQNNLLAWNKVVRDDTISDSAIRGAACIRIAALHEITRAALAEKGEPADAKGA